MDTNTVGVKFSEYKIDWTLLLKSCYEPILEVCKVLNMGACKYSADNWRKVSKEEYVKGLCRHVIDGYLSGEVEDPAEKTHHLSHAICCCLFLIWFDIRDGLFTPFTPDYKAIKLKYEKQFKEAQGLVNDKITTT